MTKAKKSNNQSDTKYIVAKIPKQNSKNWGERENLILKVCNMNMIS